MGKKIQGHFIVQLVWGQITVGLPRLGGRFESLKNVRLDKYDTKRIILVSYLSKRTKHLR